jgi:type IV pilus assembly protein PilX
MSTLEERMSGNMRDRSVAMQAAEMALRDAQQDIQGVGSRSPTISGVTGFSDTCNLDAEDDTADDGLCDRRGNLPSYSNTTISFPAFTVGAVDFPARVLDMTAAPSVAYGRFTGAANLAGLSAQPRYLIEGIRKTGGSTPVFYYRVTTRAQGVNPNTVVWLQAVFRP